MQHSLLGKGAFESLVSDPTHYFDEHDDSTGVAGALEFFDIRGDADSAMASWRSSCTKLDQTVSDCPRGEGAARWLPLATEETAGRRSDPQPHP